MAVSTPQRCLVIGPAWVGDMVMAHSLFRTLKQDRPDMHLGVVAPAWTHPLLARMPEVDRAYAMPVGHQKLGLKARWRLAKTIRQDGYDRAIVLSRSLKAALVPWFARIPIRTGFLGEQRWGILNDVRAFDREHLPLNVQRFVVLGNRPDSPTPKRHQILTPTLHCDQTPLPALLSRLNLSLSVPILVLCPGAEYGPAKQWPLEYFARVASQKIADGWAVWIMGSDKDLSDANEINALAGNNCAVLAGKTELGEAVDLINCADVVVSNDSGLMHVAAALSRPLVALYGSSSADFTPPLANNCELLALNMDCRPCFKRVCPLEHLNCLRQLKPEKVVAALHRLMQNGDKK